ncbi:MAG: hypothetical protein HY653_04475, partial [Acidobacteria bacterium]|nr:hypothetical protein [Acidobacteriota bacterium]
EFLLALRRFLLSLGRAHQQAPATPFTLEDFWALLQEFPPLQREMILLTLRGYSPEEINRMHRFEQSSGQQILNRLLEKSASLLGQSFRDDLLRMNHDALFASIEQQPTDKCVPDRTYVRLFDGQVSWREKENFELHIESCLYCLARLAEYREVFYYFQKLPAADPARLGEIGAALGLLPERAEKPRGLARLIPRLGRSARKV